MSNLDRLLVAIGFLLTMATLALNMQRNATFAEQTRQAECLNLAVSGDIVDITSKNQDLVNDIADAFLVLCEGVDIGVRK